MASRRMTGLYIVVMIAVIVAVDFVLFKSRPWERLMANPVNAILHVFGRYGAQAVAVSRCETGGTFSVYAQNGQYLGVFQMGFYARSRYGHSWTAIGQARAAYRYFVDSGRDWSPWECKPW